MYKSHEGIHKNKRRRGFRYNVSFFILSTLKLQNSTKSKVMFCRKIVRIQDPVEWNPDRAHDPIHSSPPVGIYHQDDFLLLLFIISFSLISIVQILFFLYYKGIKVLILSSIKLYYLLYNICNVLTFYRSITGCIIRRMQYIGKIIIQD